MVEEVDGNEIVLKVLTCKLSDGVHWMGLFALPFIVWPIFETLTRIEMMQAAAAVGDYDDDDDEKPPNGLRILFRFFLRFWLFIVTDNLRLIKELLTTCFLSGSRWRLPHYPKAPFVRPFVSISWKWSAVIYFNFGDINHCYCPLVRPFEMLEWSWKNLFITRIKKIYVH